MRYVPDLFHLFSRSVEIHVTQERLSRRVADGSPRDVSVDDVDDRVVEIAGKVVENDFCRRAELRRDQICDQHELVLIIYHDLTSVRSKILLYA